MGKSLWRTLYTCVCIHVARMRILVYTRMQCSKIIVYELCIGELSQLSRSHFTVTSVLNHLLITPPPPGGSDPTPPPLLSRKRMDVERRTRRNSKDLDETLPNHFRKFKIEVTCQVKVRSKVKIGCFQVADRSDLKRSIFRPKLSTCTPKDQAKVLTSEIVSYLAQVKVKVRSEKVTKPKIFKCVV